jgi:CheY-like chemotaxis protein
MGQRITLANLEILFVEDDALVAESVVEFLRGQGATVHYAENAVQAFEALRRHAGIRVMLTDIKMPIIDGRQLVEEALQFWPKLRVIFTTGVADPSTIPRSIPLLEKPYMLDELERAILQFCPPTWLAEKQGGTVAEEAREVHFEQAWSAAAASLTGSASQAAQEPSETALSSTPLIED